MNEKLLEHHDIVCCTGHPCDNCRICRTGQCCRRDSPDYQLPALGEWDGPIYGELGEIRFVEDRVECHCCGETRKALPYHIYYMHNLTTREYRAIFGLSQLQGLCSPGTSEKIRKNALEMHRAFPHLRERATQVIKKITPEQRALNATRRSLQAKKKLARVILPRQRKLTDDQVREIKTIGHTVSYKKLAQRYGVNYHTIAKIISGESYRHVTV